MLFQVKYETSSGVLNFHLRKFFEITSKFPNGPLNENALSARFKTYFEYRGKLILFTGCQSCHFNCGLNNTIDGILTSNSIFVHLSSKFVSLFMEYPAKNSSRLIQDLFIRKINLFSNLKSLKIHSVHRKVRLVCLTTFSALSELSR